jgi:nucleoid-associated protein EbfC
MSNPFNVNLDPASLKALQEKSMEIQKKMTGVQDTLSQISRSGKAGGGMVEIVVDGHYKAKSVTIDPSLLKEKVEIIQDLVKAAINDATNQVGTLVQQKMFDIVTGLGLPNFESKE